MAAEDHNKPPKPCDYFDMIGGTSTGGLIAIMLDCISAYCMLADKVFEKKSHRVTLNGKVQGRFSAAQLEKVVKKVIVEQNLNQDELFKDPADSCKVFVCATSKDVHQSIVCFTTYPSRRLVPHLYNSTTIWQACRATSAATSFFDPIAIGPMGEEFVDGALGLNNPAQDVWGDQLEKNLACLAIATETEQTANDFQNNHRTLDAEGRYYRFNAHGMESIGLEESRKKKEVSAVTNHYLSSPETLKRLQNCAKNLSRREYYGPYRVEFSLRGMPTSNNFVPRPSDITDIKKSLLPYHQKKQGCNVFVLHGLGGIGKTQLAVNFARQYQAAFSAIFWLDGTSEDSLKQSFAICAKRIPKDQIPENIRSPKTGDEVDLNDIVEHVQEWLAKDDNVDWLLIFDNVDLDHTQGKIPGAYDIRKYLRSDHNAVLITSRLSKLAQLGESKRIESADPDLMMDDDAQKLLHLLEGLPLALAQAAAYMGELNLHVASYIRLYEQQWDELFQNTDSSLLDYGNRSVWTTWTISFNAIETRDKNAGNLLRLWAFFDNREMWHSLLQVARNDQEQWPKWLRDIACNEVRFFNIATLLLRYSMIEARESEQSSYSMHPVVHRWMSHIQDDAGKRVFLRLAVMLIGFSVPDRTTKNYWVLQRQLLPHAERCLWWMEELKGGECNIEDITIGHATHSLGLLYSNQGRLKEAETMYQRALEGYEKALGPDHTSTLDTVHGLGNLYTTQGRLKEAEAMYQRALEGYEKALGPDHTSTLGTVNNLGHLYETQGRLKEAEAMYQRALSGYSAVLGSSHAKSLLVVKNIASLQLAKGSSLEIESSFNYSSADEITSTIVEAPLQLGSSAATKTSLWRTRSKIWNNLRDKIRRTPTRTTPSESTEG
ncbi:hypothetical protein B0H65DRAFT_509300 [Neurospora tetraspora]|uniref:PNPLA domain-containing protein n=1 Tax=Neurospora tetraspora TaxID=94610 RepID=A0AAE0JG10_9PEZI|nr:hypothetical protein B0H65DRAFT_509300 [Neurospora tetraspora]